ncbi:hypothetical protein MEBOL_007880 [Melittangium boletus DSM 14713]|uniref:Uncharacterized protein n=2 Tax=Melittangium boletus TaxID=83453 RepID=A0A250ISY5_9BACT|nr:hypothetical protein MEBOL_007880 [Melittangium boletus DSM 14713]
MPRMFAPLMCLFPVLALGQTEGGTLVGTSLVVNNGPGDQTDPHVSGVRVVYTHQASRSSSEIHFHDLSTGVDQAIATQGGYDSLADIQGDQVVFTRTTSTNLVYRFDLTRPGSYATELAPRSNVDRRVPSVGGHTVAWQELGYTAAGGPAEIFLYHQGTNELTRLTEDTSVDRTPAVSEDGRAVVWVKCATSSSGCDVWTARETDTGYETKKLTGSEGEESAPDTNGTLAVYVTRSEADSVLESDIAWSSLDGGETHRLSLPGTDSNPSISGPLIAFEHLDTASETPNYDIMVYDLRTQLLYRLTHTPTSESLSDMSVGADGIVRVAWAERGGGGYNVLAYTFRLPRDCTVAPSPPDAESVCASPGTRQLLGVLQSQAVEGEPTPASSEISGQGTGVLCVDNGYQGPRATSGYVWLGEGLAVTANEFGEHVAGMALPMPLQGRRVLSALAEGEVGGTFRTRLYGPLMCDVAAQDASFEATEVLYGRTTTVESASPSLTPEMDTPSFVPRGYEGLLPSP